MRTVSTITVTYDGRRRRHDWYHAEYKRGDKRLWGFGDTEEDALLGMVVSVEREHLAERKRLRETLGIGTDEEENTFTHFKDMGDEEEDGYPPRCTNPAGHMFECSGTAYGGDDTSYHGEGRCYCIYCGADGDA